MNDGGKVVTTLEPFQDNSSHAWYMPGLNSLHGQECLATVFRTDQRLRHHGEAIHSSYGTDHDAAGSNHDFALTDHQATCLFWFKCSSQDATIDECLEFLRTVNGVSISRATLCREIQRLGMSYKKMRYVSDQRDEDDRVAFWCNGPEHPIRPGLLGINYWDALDLDESGYYVSSANRPYGHSLIGVPCRMTGRPARQKPHWSVIAAVDTRVGLIKSMLYHKGTTDIKFKLFVELVLVPALVGTGRRVIMMDRLNVHFGEVASFLRQHGHYVVFRPKHSCDFGPVESVFNFVDKFLQAHSRTVTSANFKEGIIAALSCVTAYEVTQYFHDCHFYVPGLTYKPYLGQQ